MKLPEEANRICRDIKIKEKSEAISGACANGRGRFAADGQLAT